MTVNSEVERKRFFQYFNEPGSTDGACWESAMAVMIEKTETAHESCKA